MNLLYIQFMANGTVSRQFLSYATRNEALSALYYNLWASIADTNVVKVVEELITDDGHVDKCERWQREVQTEEI